MFPNRFPSQPVTTRTSNRSTRKLYQYLLPLLLLGLLATANAQPSGDAVSYLPPIGGSGGGQFKSPCGATENLMGFELRVGDDVDAIRPVCVVTYGPARINPPALTTGSGVVPAPGSLGGAFANNVVAPGWFGGPGGQIERLLCPAKTPIVLGMDIAAEGVDTIVVNNIHLYCGQAVTAQTLQAYPSAIFDAPGYTPSPGWLGIGIDGDPAHVRGGHQVCPAGQVAVGLHGRSGKWLDAMGLICGAPRMDTSVRALGRVGTPSSGPPVPICEAAKSARARNSPAAPGLEAQCAASRPHVALGRVQTTQAPGGPPSPICDAAKSARERNSPSAPALEARCRALGGGQAPPADTRTPDELAAAGENLANSDPLSAELRNREPAGPNRRGFDIGMAAAEGNTEWGPGQQKILASLSAAEQEGFKVAISFSLDRNRNARLAAIGASIADADQIVARTRTADPDVRYWLGFDIASGIFGDPALGADGNTATGPGSMKIRDALSAPAQRGFNASVKLHLSRKY
ncbi:MAG TPA: hypothetical protein VGQ12_09610 [Candidatus Angelobacter sp.]|jgi:hypothetical protein|nr:hypothetical protein [Candidatus Angelobacter sp.]